MADDTPDTTGGDVQDVDAGGGSVTTQAPAQDAAQTPAAPQTPTPAGPIAAEEASYAAEKDANTEAAQATGGQGSAEAQILNSGAGALQALPTQSAIVNSYADKDARLAQQFADKKVDPQRFYNNLGTGQKIAAGIGMLLSGFGSGASKQPNLAMKVMDDAISNDIDSQKNAQGQAMTLWKMNREAMGNEQAANLATQNQMMAGLKYKLNAAASQFQGPLAKANADHANALIDRQMAQNRFKLGLMNPSSDAPDPSTRVQFLVPPEKQQKVFDEIEAAQNTVKNAPAILEAFDRAANTVHGADFVPGVQNADQKALHVLLGPTFKDVEGTVRQAAMDSLYQNALPQDFDDKETKATKRASLIGYLGSKSAAPTAKGFGIDLTRYPSTNLNAAFRAVTPPAPSGTTTMGGVHYQKVPGGWQKVKGQ